MFPIATEISQPRNLFGMPARQLRRCIRVELPADRLPQWPGVAKHDVFPQRTPLA